MNAPQTNDVRRQFTELRRLVRLARPERLRQADECTPLSRIAAVADAIADNYPLSWWSVANSMRSRDILGYMSRGSECRRLFEAQIHPRLP